MIAAGFGFRAGAGSDSLADALARARGPAPDVLATASDKAATPAFRAFAAACGLPAQGIGAAALAAAETRTQSPASLAARGTGSLAEAAALAAAGRRARLLGPRAVSGDGMATCALAEGEGP